MFIDLSKSKQGVEHIKENFGSDAMKLFKQLENDHLTLTDYLESLDPTEVDGDGNAPFNALERHLMALDMNISGANQISVEKLMSSAEYLAPEMVKREILAGMQSTSNQFDYRDCIAASVPSKTVTYHPLYIPNMNLSSAVSRREKSLGARAINSKGGEYPVISIRLRDKDIHIGDYGRTIETSYNVIKDYGWSDFAIMLRLIGSQLSADKLQDIYDLAITGDGTVGAASNTFGGAAGTLAYTDLITNYVSFDSPFTMSRILAPQTSVETILAMAQFTDPLSGWEFQKTGKMVSPMGAKLKQVRTTPGSTPTGTVIATIDHRYAVREVVHAPLMVEAEKIINRKFEQAVVTDESSFCVIADGALKRIVWT